MNMAIHIVALCFMFAAAVEQSGNRLMRKERVPADQAELALDVERHAVLPHGHPHGPVHDGSQEGLSAQVYVSVSSDANIMHLDDPSGHGREGSPTELLGGDTSKEPTELLGGDTTEEPTELLGGDTTEEPTELLREDTAEEPPADSNASLMQDDSETDFDFHGRRRDGRRRDGRRRGKGPCGEGRRRQGPWDYSHRRRDGRRRRRGSKFNSWNNIHQCEADNVGKSQSQKKPCGLDGPDDCLNAGKCPCPCSEGAYGRCDGYGDR